MFCACLHVYDVCVSVFEGSETKTGQHLQKLWPGCTTDSGLSQKISSFRLSVRSVCLTARSSSLSGSIYTYRTGEMKGKLVIAVILALQVSASLCDLPEPEKELVEKYDQLKQAFYKRLLGVYGKAKDAVGPLTETMPQGQFIKDYIEELQGKPQLQSAVKIATGVAGEVTPLVDKARTAVLGLYGEYVRPWAGTYLDQGITYIRSVLDTVMPIEQK
ncbi:hypothetical protein AGOR_G00212610 [Albula goreensis]|uniref:Apolipoprotein A-II n=1 Tax=Albula goreensis TaxID=1534307 RepID=A0A8T3CMI6_9TELE|nr:hypothetical protein AGOR_G00212610 [Albula goreensis]